MYLDELEKQSILILLIQITLTGFVESRGLVHYEGE